jgi:hypothetical protein
MSDSYSVILQTLDAGFFKAPPKAHPSSVYVVSYKNGSVRAFPGVPSAGDRMGGQFCYIIDTAEHRAAGQCTIPSSVDAYSFTVEMSATWKVTDAEAVVRENVADGSAAVLDWLKDQLWQIGRQFPPGQSGLAEVEARSLLAGNHPLSQGITVRGTVARFTGDTQLANGQRTLDDDSLQGQLDQQRFNRLKDRLDGGDASAILEHLLQHPGDTGTVLTMMSAGRERNQTLQLGILKELLERGLITDADAQPLRDAVLGGGPAIPASSAGPAVGWSRPALSLPSGVTLAPGSAPAGSVSQSAQAPVTAYVDDDDDDPSPAGPARKPIRRTPTGSTPAASPAGATTVGAVKGWKSVGKRPQGGQ